MYTREHKPTKTRVCLYVHTRYYIIIGDNNNPIGDVIIVTLFLHTRKLKTRVSCKWWVNEWIEEEWKWLNEQKMSSSCYATTKSWFESWPLTPDPWPLIPCVWLHIWTTLLISKLPFYRNILRYFPTFGICQPRSHAQDTNQYALEIMT